MIRKLFALSVSLGINLILLACISSSGWTKVISNNTQEVLNQEISQFENPQALANALHKIFHEKDPNQRLQLISHWLPRDSKEIINKEKQPYIWATLKALNAETLVNLENGYRPNNLEQAIINFNQSLEVYSISGYLKREESLIKNIMPYLHFYRFRIAQEEAGRMDVLTQQFSKDVEEQNNRAEAALINSMNNIHSVWSKFSKDLKAAAAESKYKKPLEDAVAQQFRELDKITTKENPYQNKEIHEQINQQLGAILNSVKGMDKADISEFQKQFNQSTSLMTPNTRETMQHIYGEQMHDIKDEITSWGTMEIETQEIIKKEFNDLKNREKEPDLAYFAVGIEPEMAIFSYLIDSKDSMLKFALQDNERHFQNSRLTPQGRLHIIERSRDLFDTAIEAELQKRNYTQALYLLERSKARLLRESLLTDDVYLSHLPLDKKKNIQNLQSEISNLEIKLQDNQKQLSKEERWVLRIELMKKKEEMLNNNIGLKLSDQEINQLVANLPLNSAIIAPIFTDKYTIVFILPAGTQSITESHVLVIPDFSRRSLRSMTRGGKEEQWASDIFSYWDWVNETNPTIHQEKKSAWQKKLNLKNMQQGGYIEAYRDWISESDDTKRKAKHENWQNQLEISLNEMRIRMLEPILVKLGNMGIHAGARLFWLPDDDSSMLPLHTVMINGSPLLATYKVQFVPSLASLMTAQKRLQKYKAKEERLFALINPTNNLDFAPIEGDLINRYFTHSAMLHGDSASFENVNQGLIDDTFTYLHFATHGSYQWQNPLDSGLELSQGQKLNLKYLFSNPNLLNGKRLAVLSACETGLIDVNIPTEALGLPNAFLQSGVPGVISTLWAVNDGSTMLLMDKFYKLNREDNIDPPEALARAQNWLRTATNEELKELLGTKMNEVSSPDIRKQMGILLTELREGKSFQNPYYWAGFVYSGT